MRMLQLANVTRARPAFAGVDPGTRYADCNSDDNVVDVTDA